MLISYNIYKVKTLTFIAYVDRTFCFLFCEKESLKGKRNNAQRNVPLAKQNVLKESRK